jgi:hypothetical protein
MDLEKDIEFYRNRLGQARNLFLQTTDAELKAELLTEIKRLEPIVMGLYEKSRTE